MDEDVLTKYDNLIWKSARQHYRKNPRFDVMDLVEEGRVVAINAAEKYNPDRGTKFITYLTTTLHRELDKYVATNSWDLSVPEHVQRGREKKSEIAKTALAVRLDAIQDDSDNGEMPMFTIPSGELSPEDLMIKNESVDVLMQELDRLPDREKQVISLRYLENKTLKEVAEKMDVAKQTILNWERSGFEQLKSRVRRRLED